MRPPQARPTDHAVSSLTPNSRVRTLPSVMDATASSITAPSMQPPETEPTNAPSSRTAFWLPAWRSAKPQIFTTGAGAAGRPAPGRGAAAAGGAGAGGEGERAPGQ